MDSPIEYPKITIAGQPCEVRFSNAALYRLEKSGIDLREFGEQMKTGRLKMSMIYDLLSAGLRPAGATYSSIRLFSAEALADMVDIEEATQVVVAAMGKVRPSATVTLREPAANPEAVTPKPQ